MNKNKRKSHVLKTIALVLYACTMFLLGCSLGRSYKSNSFHASRGALGSVQGSVIEVKPKLSSSIKAQSISGEVYAGGAEVWIENLPNLPHVFTNSSGSYLLENVPPGSHVIVAKYVKDGQVYKAKSSAINIDGSGRLTLAPYIEPQPAESVLTGILRDSEGSPLPAGTPLTLWGENFMVGLGGAFQTPPLPAEVTTAEILVKMPGTQEKTSFVGTFIPGPVPAYQEQMVLPATEENQAPSGILISKDSTGSETIRCQTLEQLFLTLEPYDPNSADIPNLTYSWAATNGKLSVDGSGLQAVWTAMAEPSVATVTVEITDPQGANSKVSLRLLVEVTTLEEVDSIGPAIISQSPSENSTSVAINAPIEVVFDEPVLPASVATNSIIVLAGTNQIPGITKLESDGKTLVWAASELFPYLTDLTISVSGNIRDSLGNPSGKETIWTATTISAPTDDPFAPAGGGFASFASTPSSKSITTFDFDQLVPKVAGSIDQTNKKIILIVPSGTDVTSLVPSIVHDGASISPNSGVSKDFTNPVTYTVTASDNSTQAYEVTVTISTLPTKAITDFRFSGLSPEVISDIDESAKTIQLYVPAATDISSLAPSIIHSGLSISPNSGVAQNFTSPVIYTVTASDASTANYTVTVTKARNNEKAIEVFDLRQLSAPVYGAIDDGNQTVTLTVPYGTDVTALVPFITYSGNSISPQSGVAQNFTNPVTYTVYDSKNKPANYMVTVVEAPSSETQITSFILTNTTPQIEGIIDQTNRTISLPGPYGTDITYLVPSIIHAGASISPQSGSGQDFTNPITYTVNAADGSTADYVVTADETGKTDRDITIFDFRELEPIVQGIIDGTSISLSVPFGTDVTTLVPYISYTGISVVPGSDVPQDFTNPVTYTVTSAIGSTRAFTVTVSVEPNKAKEITAFNFNGLSPSVSGVVDGTNKRVILTVPSGTDVSALTPTITHTGASISPNSGTAQNFASPIIYTVTAADASTQNYEVIVIVEASAEKALATFNLNGLSPSVTGVVSETNKTVTLDVPFGTNVTTLVPTITHTGVAISPNSGVVQDFTNPVIYRVTAENGTTQDYQVTVTAALNPAKAITAFDFNGFSPTVSGGINETAKTVSLVVPYGSDVTSLIPTITHTGASISPNSGVAQDFTSPVTYTVTAENSTTQTYTVTVGVALNPAKEISSLKFSNTGAVAPIAININEAMQTIAITVPQGTDITALALTINHSGTSISPANGSVQDFSSPVVYTVTAEDSTKKDYTVSATNESNPGDYTSPNIGSLKAMTFGVFQRDDSAANISKVTTFRMSAYEVTQAQYQAIMGYNPSWCVTPNVATNDSNRPVEKVTWFDAIEFCNKLSESEGLPKAYTIIGRTPASGYPITDATVTLTGENGYRLPTEAEWQWASMGLTDSRDRLFSGDVGTNQIASYAWFYDNSVKGLIPSDADYGTHAVGTKLPNGHGLYDMSGNVAEWCWDQYDAYPGGSLVDPTGASSGTYRVVRGGSWLSNLTHNAVGFRRYFFPGKKYDFYGIRVVRN